MRSQTKQLAIVLATLIIFVAGVPGVAGSADKYANQEATKVVTKMIEAHGGMAAWKKINTLYVERFQRPYSGREGAAGRDWHFNITADLRGWRVYERWWDEADVVWDGEKGWQKNFPLPFPAKFVSTIGLYLSNLPWKTQDPGVLIGSPEIKTRPFPGAEKDYITLKVTFKEGVGITWNDSYILYIDPDTYLMKGCLINQTYAALLPPEMEALQFNYIIKNYVEVEGLKMPGEFNTFLLNGAKIADGQFKNWKFNVPFDERRLEMPPDGVLDTSNARRIASQ